MEDRGRSSRTYENRRTYGKSQERRPSDNHPPRRQRTPAERARMRRRRKRQRMIRFVLLIILIIAAIAGIILWKRYSPSKEQYDMKKYYGIEKDGQVGITVDNKVVEAEGKLAGGKVYVAYNIVRDYINSRFYWDPNENVLLYMLPEDMISVDVGSKDYSISKKKKSEDYVILKTEGNTAYIALDFVQQYTNIDYEVSNNPDHVMIRTKWGKTDVATVKKNTQVRYQGGVKSPVLAELKKKDLGIKKADKEEASNEYEKGEIKSQNPGKGKKVKKNSTVTVVISSGEAAKKVTVPNVVNRSEAEAERMLQDAGLKVTKGEAVYDDTIEMGNVVSSTPGSGEQVDEGTSVQLIISKGKDPEKDKVEVPSLLNMTADQAAAALEELGLKGSPKEEYAGGTAGTVVTQETEAGTKVKKGTTIKYTVTLGSKTEWSTIPSDVIGMEKNTAVKVLTEAGFVPVYGGEDYSDTPVGTIYSVTPSAGTKVEKGTQVYYFVSKGSSSGQTDPENGGDNE